jgi:hypothetical protein
VKLTTSPAGATRRCASTSGSPWNPSPTTRCGGRAGRVGNPGHRGLPRSGFLVHSRVSRLRRVES